MDVTEVPARDLPVAVVDYGAGNLLSIAQALARLGAQVRVVRHGHDLGRPALVVVPGVGAQGPAIRRLHQTGLAAALSDAVEAGAWYLGICLGMQLLFERSEEDDSAGLAWLRGETRRLPDAPRLPHIGWNEVVIRAPHPVFQGLPARVPMYFVHSYAPLPADPAIVVADTSHGGTFTSAIASRRLLGLQFHPEKSGPDGLQVLRNVLSLVSREEPEPPVAREISTGLDPTATVRARRPAPAAVPASAAVPAPAAGQAA